MSRSDSRGARRTRPVLQVGAGVAGAVAVLLLLVVPVIVMLLLVPRGTPTRLPDGMAIVLLAVVGVLIGWLMRTAGTRPSFAVTLAVLITLLALWFQVDTWLRAGWAPSPPLLPNVGPTLVFVSGAALATAVVALKGSVGSAPDTRDQADGSAGTGGRAAIVLGMIAALVLVAAVEADVWGRRVIQETFQGPGGLGRFTWLGLMFLALLVAGVLLGTLTATARTAIAGPGVAFVLLALAVAAIWVTGGGLGGPPRTMIYGLGIGILAATVAAAAWPSRRPK